jgi:hypothetical protein
MDPHYRSKRVVVEAGEVRYKMHCVKALVQCHRIRRMVVWRCGLDLVFLV